MLQLARAPSKAAGRHGQDIDDGEEGNLLAALRANGAATPHGTAVFRLLSRANHSCAPNAMLRPDPSGTMSIVATQDIAVGDEILISYLSSEDLLRPTPARQRE